MPEAHQNSGECEHIRMPHSVPRGLLRYLIISLLKQNEMTGTDIMDTLEERSGGHWRPSPGSIYPLLKSLEDSGTIETISESGRSKTYSLSKEGHERLHEFQKRGDLKHKARLSRIVWLQLLEPHERAQFYLSGMLASGEVLLEMLDELNKREKDRLMKRLSDLKRIIDELEVTLSAGGSRI